MARNDCHNCKHFFDCDKLTQAFWDFSDGLTDDVEDYEGECFDNELSEY